MTVSLPCVTYWNDSLLVAGARMFKRDGDGSRAIGMTPSSLLVARARMFERDGSIAATVRAILLSSRSIAIARY